VQCGSPLSIEERCGTGLVGCCWDGATVGMSSCSSVGLLVSESIDWQWSEVEWLLVVSVPNLWERTVLPEYLRTGFDPW
jgi:hypothetical protein